MHILSNAHSKIYENYINITYQFNDKNRSNRNIHSHDIRKSLCMLVVNYRESDVRFLYSTRTHLNHILDVPVCQYSPTSFRNRGQGQFIYSLLPSSFEAPFKDKTVTEHRPPKRTIPRMRWLTLAMLPNDLRPKRLLRPSTRGIYSP